MKQFVEKTVDRLEWNAEWDEYDSYLDSVHERHLTTEEIAEEVDQALRYASSDAAYFTEDYEYVEYDGNSVHRQTFMNWVKNELLYRKEKRDD